MGVKPANNLPVEVAVMLTPVIFAGYKQQSETKVDHEVICSHTADN